MSSEGFRRLPLCDVNNQVDILYNVTYYKEERASQKDAISAVMYLLIPVNGNGARYIWDILIGALKPHSCGSIIA